MMVYTSNGTLNTTQDSNVPLRENWFLISSCSSIKLQSASIRTASLPSCISSSMFYIFISALTIGKDTLIFMLSYSIIFCKAVRSTITN